MALIAIEPVSIALSWLLLPPEVGVNRNWVWATRLANPHCRQNMTLCSVLKYCEGLRSPLAGWFPCTASSSPSCLLVHSASTSYAAGQVLPSPVSLSNSYFLLLFISVLATTLYLVLYLLVSLYLFLFCFFVFNIQLLSSAVHLSYYMSVSSIFSSLSAGESLPSSNLILCWSIL